MLNFTRKCMVDLGKDRGAWQKFGQSWISITTYTIGSAGAWNTKAKYSDFLHCWLSASPHSMKTLIVIIFLMWWWCRSISTYHSSPELLFAPDLDFFFFFEKSCNSFGAMHFRGPWAFSCLHLCMGSSHFPCLILMLTFFWSISEVIVT